MAKSPKRPLTKSGRASGKPVRPIRPLAKPVPEPELPEGIPDGPHLGAAVFCDQVVNDQRDGAPSLIRVTDTIVLVLPDNAPEDFPSEENRIHITLTSALVIKTGNAPGEHDVHVVMRSPSGKESDAHKQVITLTEPEQGGANITIRHNIGIIKGGPFWFKVYIDGKLLACMPIHIAVKRDSEVREEAEKAAAAISAKADRPT